MTRRRWVLVAIAIAAATWVIGGEWASIHAHVPENHFLDALVGLTFFGAGMVALDQRPGNIIGSLMIAFVVTGWVGNWTNLGLPVFPTLLLFASALQAPLLAHIALAYPSGTVSSKFDRRVLATIYGATLITATVAAATFPRRGPGCVSCPWTPLLFPSPSVFRTAMWLTDRLAIVLVPLFIAAVILRWQRATHAERRYLAPLWVAVTLLAVVFLIGAFGPSDPTTDPFAHLIWQLRSMLELAVPILFVWGLLSTRLARSAVGDLVVELERPMLPEDLNAALARALGDPTLEIAYSIEDHWVDGEGRPTVVEPRGAGSDARAVTIVERDGERLGALIHDPALDEGLVYAAGVAAGMAIANERLRAEVRAQLEEVRASRQRIVEAGDAARRRVERDLHDGAQQRLVGLALGLRMLQDRHRDASGLEAEVQELQAELRAALGELRELARGLHPQILTEEGLGAAIGSLAERSSVPVTVSIDSDERLPQPVEATAYFVVSEALANVTKYAQATAAAVHVSRRNGSLVLDVTDDGVGGARVGAGSGLTGLLDRVAAVGGTLGVESLAGEGTHLHAEIPWA